MKQGRKTLKFFAFFAPFAVQILLASPALGADEPWKFQGLLEFRSFIYPRRSSKQDTHFQAGSFASFSLQRRWDRFGKIFASVEAEIDSHHDVARTRVVDWNGRDLRSAVVRPREAYWENRFGPLDLRIGRQEIRWGRADGINPTDNLAPYDFLNPFQEQRLPVTAVKGDLYRGSSHWELAWIPWYTPSRLPLLGQRWLPLLPSVVDFFGTSVPVEYSNGERRYPALGWSQSQFGARWNYAFPGTEFSFSYYDGLNDLPFLLCAPCALGPGNILRVQLDREYHRQRVFGGDFSTALGAWGLRGESAYVRASDARDDSYVSYVLGIDRQWGNWFTILEFFGQWVARRGNEQQNASFDRGLGKGLLFRTQYELGTDETVELLAILRLPTGDNSWRLTYSRKLTNRWQCQVRASVFAGNQHAFLGQFQDSNNVALKLAYRW